MAMILRMLPASRLPQYWAARIRMAPSTPAENICRKVCSKKCFKIFDKVSATLDSVNSHIAQVEFGTKAWNQIFEPLKKTKNKDEKLKSFGVGGTVIYVSPSTGLIALTENRYKIFIFGKTTLACVYRLADLYEYEYESETVKNSEGKDETKMFLKGK